MLRQRATTPANARSALFGKRTQLSLPNSQLLRMGHPQAQINRVTDSIFLSCLDCWSRFMVGSMRVDIRQAGVTEWRPCLIKSDLHLKVICQFAVGLGRGQLQGPLGGCHRFGKSSGLGVGGRQGAKDQGIWVAG